ncbi:K02A2.6-like [Cordylochernes scorpioides]|uniref:RNA-directed DNA polymerase n=1 Tax=Cordylochernes scorpioides TaxID=51811 RepID=A0ABY6LV26_9ARAC|nr:K02A2.6-like [Cordylochernes scorpioides]
MVAAEKPSELALHGNVAENWRRFKQRLMLYLEATEKATKPDKLKVAILLNFIGEEDLEVFNTFHLKEDEAENFDLVINKFDDFCEPKKNVIFERFKFFSATQKDGESIDSFITELKGLSTSCEFESQKDSLIRDRIVYGIQDKALQERLLREPNLTLLKAIEMCKTDEISKQQIKIMQNNQQHDLVSNAPILTFFDPTKPITISSDASQYGIGTVLMQGGQAIEYASFSLNATQRKYAQIEKELLAIVFGCERFQYYIWGNDVIVETDHKPLLSIVKKPLEKLSPRLQRMVLRLMRFQISLKFTPGKNMFVADHLSRDPLKDEVDTSYLEGQTESVHMLLVTTDEKIKRLQKETHGDHTLIQLIEYAKNGWPKYKTMVCDEAKPYWQFQDEIHVSDGIVYKGNCIVVPSTLRKEILQVVHSSHQGIAASKEKARSAFYWPGMITQVENEVEKCRTCQEYPRKNPEESRIAHEIPEFPWEKIAVDFMEGSRLNRNLPKGVAMVHRTHGIPRTLVSDNGPPFNSTGFKNFAQKYEFKHQTSSPKYPRSNGQVERTIQTIKGLIIKAVKSGRDPNLALMEFNNTPKYDLPSPTQMLMGRSVRTLSTYTRQQLKPLFDTTKNYQKLRDHQQKYAGSPKRILRPLEVGDNIMLQERHRKWVPATVTAKHETPRSYMVKTPSGSEYRRNRSHLRPRKFSVEDSAPTSQSPSIPGSQAGTAMDDNIQDHGRPTSENRRAYDPREDIAKKVKLQILREIEVEKKKKTDVAQKHNIPQSSLSTIIKNSEKIHQQALHAGESSRKRARGSTYADVDEALLQWFKQARSAALPVNGPLLSEKAKTLALEFGLKDFTGSGGWIERWKARHGIKLRNICGESADVNRETMTNWLTDVMPNIISNYACKDIFNTDETGLFWRLLPDKTLHFKGETCTGGKASKERITILLCCNMDGSEKMQPLVIGKAKQPRCFRGIKHLPVQYEANQKAWMTGLLFESWVRHIDKKMAGQHRQIILLLDNCGAHPPDMQGLTNTAMIYRTRLMRKYLTAYDAGAALTINLKQAVDIISVAWNDVLPATISNCWHHSGIIKSDVSSPLDTPQPATQMWEQQSLFDRMKEVLKIPLEMDFDSYADADNDVVTNAMLSDVEIVESILQAKEEEETDQVDEEVDPIVHIPHPKDVLESIQTLRLFLQCQDESKSLHRHLSDLDNIEKSVQHLLLTSKCQKKITNYFSKNT